jgi:type I restriction enzyme, S subunit
MSVELPLGWVLAQLEDLTKDPKQDIVDGPFGSNLKASEYVDEGAPIVRLQNIDRNRFLDKNIRCVTSQKAEELSRHSFISGDIIITKLGDPVGKACLIPCSLSNGIIVADVVRARMDENRALRKYVSYAINSPIVVSEINLKVKGSTRPRVNLGHIRELEIPLAPHREQHRIVAKLEKLLAKVDACKERLEKIPAILKRFRQSVLAAACSGRLTSDWRQKNSKDETAIIFLRKLFKEGSVSAKMEADINPVCATEYPDLPVGWVYSSLSAISLSITDGDHQPPPKAESGIPFVTISKFSHGSLDLADTMFVKPEYFESLRENRRPRIGDVLYSVTGSFGIALLVETDEKFCFQRHIALIRPHPLMSNKYVFFAMSSGFAYKQTTEVATGIAQLTVPLSSLRKMIIAIPPLEEQHEIVRRVEALFKVADDIEKRYQKAKAHVDKLTQSILAKAFRGELVPQDPNDEPASERLKRIQEERLKQDAESGPGRRGSRRGGKTISSTL